MIIECLNLRAHQLKTDCQKHPLGYMKHLVTTNQKSIRDIQEWKRKESKHNTIESHQHTTEESKRIRREQRRTTKIIRKQLMAITTFLSIITLYVNGLNASIKKQMDKDVVHIYNGILYGHRKEWNLTICENMDGPYRV